MTSEEPTTEAPHEKVPTILVTDGTTPSATPPMYLLPTDTDAERRKPHIPVALWGLVVIAGLALAFLLYSGDY